MKTILFLSVFTLLCINSFGQDYKALDDKFGFRDVKLETPITSFKDCTRIPLGDDLKREFPNYVGITPKNPDLHIGTFSVESIEYWFYKDKLLEIIIEVTLDYENVDGILKVLETAYGKAKKVDRVPDSWFNYKWQGNKVDMTYEIMKKKDGGIAQATITIVSIKLQDLQIRDKNNTDDNKILDAAKKL
jgi:hypothetical protein